MATRAVAEGCGKPSEYFMHGKQQEVLESLQKSRVFFGRLAARVKCKHGTSAAAKLFETCETIDETIRAVRDGITVAEALNISTEAQSTAEILFNNSKQVH